MSSRRSKRMTRMERQERLNLDQLWQQFNPDALKRICTMRESEFAGWYDMQVTKVAARPPEDFYLFRDNGSNILAVAHLDTVMPDTRRGCNILNTTGGKVVYSGALDDRLGAFVILDLLPKMGLNFDVLLTVGEESCATTAEFFKAEKEYNWIIEFDRGGTDVVMYQYEDEEMRDLVQDAGAKVGQGSYTDICALEHLGVKAFNWGVGYEDYHGPRSHAYLDDTLAMVSRFMVFHAANAETRLEHEDYGFGRYGGGSLSGNFWRYQEWLEDHADEVEKNGFSSSIEAMKEAVDAEELASLSVDEEIQAMLDADGPAPVLGEDAAYPPRSLN